MAVTRSAHTLLFPMCAEVLRRVIEYKLAVLTFFPILTTLGHIRVTTSLFTLSPL